MCQLHILDLRLLKNLFKQKKNIHSFLWVLVHIAGAGGIVFVLVHAYHTYSTNPMVTTLYDTLYPVNEVPFPGVAICSNNRISYNAAVTLSKQL